MKFDLIDISVIVTVQTTRAVLVHEGDPGEQVWLPRSQIELEPEPDGDGYYTVTMPIWLAKEKGLM